MSYALSVCIRLSPASHSALDQWSFQKIPIPFLAFPCHFQAFLYIPEPLPCRTPFPYFLHVWSWTAFYRQISFHPALLKSLCSLNHIQKDMQQALKRFQNICSPHIYPLRKRYLHTHSDLHPIGACPHNHRNSLKLECHNNPKPMYQAIFQTDFLYL